ncbi:DUF1827 family protein [Enterococcus bulliens]|uniref:DUF1827 family protein n=1 Tax=uncultured Enterococcus sp. TaxID=167972 RepID=UPI0025F14E34|nr:DUF1827 family protein [uncultured Enterococcus sp.]
MKLVNVTNSHSRLVMQQLESTDAEMVKVYTAGDITVVYTVAPTHYEILLVNEKRAIMKNEIRDIKNYFFKKMPSATFDPEHFTIIEEPHLVELSIPIQK